MQRPRRGCPDVRRFVLIDPPFERADEADRIVRPWRSLDPRPARLRDGVAAAEGPRLLRPAALAGGGAGAAALAGGAGAAEAARRPDAENGAALLIVGGGLAERLESASREVATWVAAVAGEGGARAVVERFGTRGATSAVRRVFKGATADHIRRGDAHAPPEARRPHPPGAAARRTLGAGPLVRRAALRRRIAAATPWSGCRRTGPAAAACGICAAIRLSPRRCFGRPSSLRPAPARPSGGGRPGLAAAPKRSAPRRKAPPIPRR